MTPVDVNETVAFRRGWLRLKYLAIGAGLIAIAILDFGAILRRESLYGTHDLGTILAAFVAAALGVLMLLREVYRYVVPGEPLLILTPKAITINIDGLTCIDIPWAEVLDLATVDIKTRAAPPINVDVGGGIENEVRDTCRNVTAVAVAQDFYDSATSSMEWFITSTPGPVPAPAGRALSCGVATRCSWRYITACSRSAAKIFAPPSKSGGVRSAVRSPDSDLLIPRSAQRLSHYGSERRCACSPVRQNLMAVARSC
jgi:hypothetical protein